MSTAVLGVVWTFSLQAAVVVLGGAAASALPWSRDDARVRIALWRTVLALVIAAPLIALAWPSTASGGVPGVAQLEVVVNLVGAASASTASAGLPGVAPIVLAALAAGVAVRAARMGMGAIVLRRLARSPELKLASFDSLRQELGARARLVASEVAQPFTFGRRDAVVVVPATFAGEPEHVQRAVLGHELVHVRRGDWLQVTIEEGCGALLWFHPGAWWALSELRLAREEIVDREASQLSGSRRAYMRTLLEFASRRETHSLRAVAFFRRRQLSRRLAALAREAPMSTRRSVVTGAAAVLALLLCAHGARAAFPIVATSQDGSVTGGGDGGEKPSALEQQAHKAGKDAPPPKKIHDVAFPYSEPVRAVVPSALFVTRLVIDVDGSVVEARIIKRRIDGPPTSPQALARAVQQLSNSTLQVVRQWRFEPPAKAPLVMDVTVSYSASGKKAADALPPPSPPPPGPADGSVTRPVPVNQPNPVYPEAAKRDKIQGMVRLAVTVDKDGAVKDAHVVQSIPGLDQAALDAVRQWTFRPGTRDGVPVETVCELTINFALK